MPNIGSLSSLFAPRVPNLPSTISLPQEMHFWANQTVGAINALPPFSQFSFTSPESNVTAQARTIGINLAPASVGSTVWLKRFGSGATGWVALG